MMLMDVSRGILPTLLPHQPLQSVTRHLPPPQSWKKRSASGEQEGPPGTEMLQAAFGPVLWRGRWRPLWPKWPHFPQGARRLGKGWGSAEWHLCRSGTVCRGQALVAQSLMDLAGSLRPIAQIRTLRPKVTRTGWQSPRESPAWTLLTLPPCIALATKNKVGTERVQEGRRAQAPAPQACVSSVCVMSSQLLANICSVSHPDTFCHPTRSASLYSFLSFSVSLILSLSSLAHSLGPSELVISAPSTGQCQTLQCSGPRGRCRVERDRPGLGTAGLGALPFPG